MRSLPAPPSPLQPPRFGAGPSDALPLLGSPPLPPQSLVWLSEKRHSAGRAGSRKGGAALGGWSRRGQLQRELELGGAKDGSRLHPLAFGILPRLEL